MARHARRVARSWPPDCLQHQHRVLDQSRHQPELVDDQRRSCAPVRGAQPTSGAARLHHSTFAGETMLPPVSLPIENATSAAAIGAWSGARARCALLQQPRIHRLTANQMSFSASAPRLSYAGDQHCAGVGQPAPTTESTGGTRLPKRLSTVSCSDAVGVEEIFYAVWNAMRRADAFPAAISASAAFARASA